MKRIAVSTRVVDAVGYQESRDALAQDWCLFFDSIGLLPILVPNTLRSPETYLEELSIDGIILTGGNTVGLERETSPHGGVRPERERTEESLIKFALNESLPVMGVCRGMQMLNRFFGGNVTRNLSVLVEIEDAHVSNDHDIRLISDQWQTIAGGDTMRVNSFHDDGILKTDLAEELILTAETLDGISVEGFVHPTHQVMGIEWHVERPSPSTNFDRALMRMFFQI